MDSLTSASGRIQVNGNARSLWGLAAALIAELALVVLLRPVGDLTVPGHATTYVLLLLGAGGCYLVALRLYEGSPHGLRPRYFWSAAILLRLAALALPPADDLWRYLWEGKVQLAGHNPYLLAPDSPALLGMRDGIWALINNPGTGAIYPPGAEWLFKHLAAISATPLFFKSVFAAADLLILYLLLRINTGSGRYRASAWYAWNPAAVCFLAGAGHFDSVMMVAMVAAIWALYRANPLARHAPAWGWSIASCVFLGLAISVKLVPVVLLPVWAFALGRRSFLLLIVPAIFWAFSLPYGGVETVLAPLGEFGRVTRFNDLLWWLVELVGPAPHDNRFYNDCLAGVVLGIALVLRNDWRRATLWVLGAVLILSPALHPWYVLWILPVAAWRQQHPWFILSLSVSAALLVWEHGTGWTTANLTPWMRLAVIAPPLIALGIELWRNRSDESQPA